ncbi:MAG: hypothetical protein HW386_1886 [Gammaproteobacteria bacterium]|nr:hypothetical protein [Gammaproteobacteria bacterium]
MAEIDIEYLKRWIGRTETSLDCVTPVPVAALRATLDLDAGRPQPGESLPPLWHWLYFLPIHRQSMLSENGHPRMGEFMPPIPLPRRMYAGGRLQFHLPLRVGDAISRTSTIVAVSSRQGRTGPLVFLKISHAISNGQGLAVTEEQDIVYRTEPGPDSPAPAYQSTPAQQSWQREVTTDSILLFRFSALTFNGHRIHYDYPYVTGVEGYPGLVVHGPLLAVLLLDLLHRHMPQAQLLEFSFRALKPVFNSTPFYLCGAVATQQVKLWVRDTDGLLCFDAAATLR